jgi:hypothetical protein
MTAAAGATGFRSWLQTHRFSWLTPRRMRRLTLAAITLAVLVSTIGLSGSTPPQKNAAPAPATATR